MPSPRGGNSGRPCPPLFAPGKEKAWQRPTLPPRAQAVRGAKRLGDCGSTIGAAGLNFRVRDGNGWFPCVTVTRQYSLRGIRRRTKRGRPTPRNTVAGAAKRASGSPKPPSVLSAMRSRRPYGPAAAPRRFRASPSAKCGEGNMVKPHGKSVLVGSVGCRTYTSSLSTWFSPTSLLGS